MNEENILEELKDLKKKVEHIRDINRTTNILLALFLILFLLIALVNGFRWF
ncbi:MAG: hypothetical protein ACFFBW_07375 [Promethearchaeota archaeon]